MSAFPDPIDARLETELERMMRGGLVEKTPKGYRLTDAGRARLEKEPPCTPSARS